MERSTMERVFRWVFLPAVLAGLAYLDLRGDAGFATGLLYLAPVLLTLQLQDRRLTLVVAMASALLVTVGFLGSLDDVAPSRLLTNRALSLLAILVFGLLILRRLSAEQRLEDSERRLREIAAAVPDALWVFDPVESSMRFVSPAYERIWGRPASELQDDPRAWLAALEPEARTRVEQALSSVSTEDELDEEFPIRRVDGSEAWIHARARVVRDEGGVPLRVVGVFEDATEQRRASEQLASLSRELEVQARHDSLTGQLNRRGLQAVLHELLATARREGTSTCAALIDCDDFKGVNDRFGHTGGDRVLLEIAQRIAAQVRPSDHLARIGGDEFLVVFAETRLAEALRVADRLRREICDHPIRIEGEELRPSVSLGVARLPTDVRSLEEVVARTQDALRRSKETGKNRVSVAGEEGTREPVFVLPAPAQLGVLVQPIHDLETGEVVGHELFSRGPVGPMHRPDQLLQQALEHGQQTPADLRMLERCARTALDAGLEGALHFNILPGTLEDTPHEAVLVALGDLEPSRVVLEIAEQQLVGDPSALRAPLDRLRSDGLRIAIDDVGFGRSSLEALIMLEPEFVKIDPRERPAIDAPDRRRGLARLVKVVTELGARPIAEHVEDEDDRELFRTLGVALGQGHFWEEARGLGVPAPAAVVGSSRRRR